MQTTPPAAEWWDERQFVLPRVREFLLARDWTAVRPVHGALDLVVQKAGYIMAVEAKGDAHNPKHGREAPRLKNLYSGLGQLLIHAGKYDLANRQLLLGIAVPDPLQDGSRFYSETLLNAVLDRFTVALNLHFFFVRPEGRVYPICPSDTESLFQPF